jgi:hypothetical protein
LGEPPQKKQYIAMLCTAFFAPSGYPLQYRRSAPMLRFGGTSAAIPLAAASPPLHVKKYATQREERRIAFREAHSSETTCDQRAQVM